MEIIGVSWDSLRGLDLLPWLNHGDHRYELGQYLGIGLLPRLSHGDSKVQAGTVSLGWAYFLGSIMEIIGRS
jgi:hypothetical protein